ncbi:MAG TPA: hypothetical protein VJP40_04315 [bacterium]|nr:hypothetical protein [bacterium]
MSRTFTLCPEVEALYRQTIERACAREFLGWTTSSRQSSVDQINNTFWAAAAVNERANGETAPQEGRQLDLAEARLAIAALNRAADGDRLIAANESRAAYDQLQETIGRLDSGGGHSAAQSLMAECSARGRGWRRIRDETVQRDIRAVFQDHDVTELDPRPGMDPVDAVFAAYAYDFEVGGSGEDIDFSDAMFASASIESALRGLTTYYS